MKKKFVIAIILAIVLIVIAIFLLLVYRSVTITCYLFDPCGGCSVEENPCKSCETEMIYRNKYLGILESKGLAQRVDFHLYNTLYDKNLKAYKADIQTFSFSSDVMPVMIINGIVLEGDKEISDRMEQVIKDNLFLPSLFIPTEEKKVETEIEDVVIYFKTTGCEDCKDVENFLNDAVPKTIMIKVIELSITEDENFERLRKYCELYGANEEYLIPAIFVNADCVVGFDQIKEYFSSHVIESTTFNTKVFVDEIR